MPFIPVNQTIRTDLVQQIASQIVMMTFHLRKSSAVTPTDLANAAGDIYAWWDAMLQPLQVGAVQTLYVKATDLSSSTGGVFVYTPATPVYGVKAGEPIANNAAVCVTLGTAQRGRSYRGRNYVPGISENDVTDGVTIGAGTVAALQAAWVAINGYISAHGFQHSVVSRVQNYLPLISGIITPIISYYVENHLDSQRRRLYGRGI